MNPIKPKLSVQPALEVLSVIAAASLAACAGGAASETPKDGLRINVAALELTGVEEVTYGIKVVSQLGTVWEQTGLTSTQYGDGESALSYIGPCDASADANPHTVELTLERMRAGGRELVDPADFRNPAPAGAPLSISGIVCRENSDVPVDFNLTILRAAKQGFFDFAVEFEDIFCSAKLDCKDALLHNGDVRDATAVVAFACTSGVGDAGGPAQDTFLYLSDLVLTCDGLPALAPIVLPAVASTPGQHGSPGAGVFEWAAYQGDEQLTSNGEALEKCYWNRAIGIDKAALQGRNCTVSGIATATSEPLNATTLTGAGVSYPIVRFNVEVLSAAGTLCGANPLNVVGSGVQTEYVTSRTDPRTLRPLTGVMSCGGADPAAVECAAGATTNNASAGVVVTQVTSPEGTSMLSVQTGGAAPTDIVLTGNLAGYTLGANCCQDSCCGTPDPVEELSTEEFKTLADANGLWDVPLGTDGYPIEAEINEDAVSGDGKMSNNCSIASSRTGATATFGSPTSRTGNCYGYYGFPSDNENDCYIKFSNYRQAASYKFQALNQCANAARAYYGNQLAAYFDSSSNVYLRLDRRWCRYSNCEDGFRIQ